MKWIRTLCLAVLGCLAAAACAAGGASPAISTTDAAAFDAVLIELFGTEDTDAYLVTAERHAAELVVTCMADAGFAFEIPPDAAVFERPAALDLDAAQAEGFGIVAGFRFQISQSDPTRQLQDPNQAYLRTLSSAEIQRFLVTLDGVDAAPGQRKEDAGCNGAASDQAYADWKRFAEALPNYTSLAEERDTHPDWVAARSAWHNCMVDRGFDYAEPDAIRTDVISRMRDLVNEAYPGRQLPLVQQDGVFMVDPQVDGLLSELVQFERAAAVANVECSQPVADQFNTVEQQVQQDYVDRNRATIDELLAGTGRDL